MKGFKEAIVFIERNLAYSKIMKASLEPHQLNYVLSLRKQKK